MKTLLPRFRFAAQLLVLCAAPWAAHAAPSVSCVAQADEAEVAPNPEFIQWRGAYENSRLRFEREKKGHVAFLGGSITEMDGYRPMVCEILKRRFPETDFQFTAAGISSTCSTTGAFRLEADVLSQGPVDLFFVEFAVNDDQDAAHSREECIRGLEGIIRHVRRYNPNADIVVTYFINPKILEKLQAGETPLTIEAHEAVAQYYGVSSIHLARETASRISAGTLSWQKFGGVHPAPYGNAICAHMIDQLLDRAWAQPLAQNAAPVAHPMPAAPLEKFNYENGRFIDPAKAKVRSGWSLGIPDWTALPGGKRPRFTSVPMFCASEPGAEAELAFEGTAVGAFVVAGPDAGKIEARIDSGPFHTVDLFHEHSVGLHYPRTVLFGSELATGPHTLTIRVAEDSSGTGHAARILQFVAN